jgi:hypothetical protein
MDAKGAGQHPMVIGPGAQSAEAWLPDGRVLIADYGAPQASWYILGAGGEDARSVPQLAGLQGPVDWIGR